MEFLWVCWVGGDINHAAGWESRRLHRVGFLDAADPDGGTFGFWIPPKSLEQGISFQHFFTDVPQSTSDPLCHVFFMLKMTRTTSTTE